MGIVAQAHFSRPSVKMKVLLNCLLTVCLANHAVGQDLTKLTFVTVGGQCTGTSPCDNTILAQPSITTDVCVKAYTTEKKTWADAQATCQGNGGNLVTIKNKAMNDAVNNLVKDVTFGNKWDGMWLGLRRPEGSNDDTYEWRDGTGFSFAPTVLFEDVVNTCDPYTDWQAKQPTAYGLIKKGTEIGDVPEQCVAMFPRWSFPDYWLEEDGTPKRWAGTGLWNDRECDEQLFYVCEEPCP